jgi:hypothetical protein
MMRPLSSPSSVAIMVLSSGQREEASVPQACQDPARHHLMLLNLDRQNVSLAPDAAYRASSGDRQRVFTIARSAKSGNRAPSPPSHT